jgi:hypothetical protein
MSYLKQVMEVHPLQDSLIVRQPIAIWKKKEQFGNQPQLAMPHALVASFQGATTMDGKSVYYVVCGVAQLWPATKHPLRVFC